MKFRIKHVEAQGRYVPQVWDGAASGLWGEWKTIRRFAPGHGFWAYSRQQIIDAGMNPATGYVSAEEARRACEDYERWARTGEEPGVSYDYFDIPQAEDAGN